MSLQQKFDKAVAIIQSLPKDGEITPSQDQQLIFYKYYKQATIGEVNTPRPGLFDFVGKAKWDAWDSVKDVSKEEAQTKYVDTFIEVLKSSDTQEARDYLKELEG